MTPTGPAPHRRRQPWARLVLVGAGCAIAAVGRSMTHDTNAAVQHLPGTLTNPISPAPHDPLAPLPSTLTFPTADGSGITGNGTALKALHSLPLRPAGPRTGYSRAQFGPAWADVRHVGCDERDQILARDLAQCHLPGGQPLHREIRGARPRPLHRPRRHIHPKRPYHRRDRPRRRAGPDLDHRRRPTHPHGAEELAEDPLELLAVDGRTNVANSDDATATWLPPNAAYDCPFVARVVAVKTTYRLWTTPAEHAALARVLAGCPTQELPRPRDPRQPDREAAMTGRGTAAYARLGADRNRLAAAHDTLATDNVLAAHLDAPPGAHP